MDSSNYHVGHILEYPTADTKSEGHIGQMSGVKINKIIKRADAGVGVNSK